MTNGDSTLLLFLTSLAAAIAAAGFALILRHRTRIILGFTTTVLLLITAGTAWSRLHPSSLDVVTSLFKNRLPEVVSNLPAAFYATPMGYALGSLALTVISIAGPLALSLLTGFMIYRRLSSRAKYNKRCSACHHSFSGRTRPYRCCPRCGAYWNYEKKL